jgi:hypothetical protein
MSLLGSRLRIGQNLPLIGGFVIPGNAARIISLDKEDSLPFFE